MKGVSEIIAIILILMIVIALAALAYTWFSGVFASLTGSANAAINANQQQMNTEMRIESAKGVSSSWVTVSIRNLGTTNINGSSLTTGFYTDGNLVTVPFNSPNKGMGCTGCLPGTCDSTDDKACNILPSAVATYNFTPTVAITCGTSIVKVTNGPATDSRVISC